MSAITGWQQGDSKTAVTAMEAAQIWICGRGCVKRAEMAVTTQWQS